MRVKKETPAKDQNSFIYHWDKTAREYFDHFEIQLKNQREGIQRNFKNALTSWKDTSKFHKHLKAIDLLHYRQALGDISKQEVQELNKVLGGRYHFTKSWTEPAKIYAWDKMTAYFWAIGATSAIYGKFLKGYSIVWLVVPFAPCWSYMLYNRVRQPIQDIENAYRYTIQKRAATAEYDKNRSKVDSALNKYSTQKDQLRRHLEANNSTLYDLEADLYDKLTKGSL